MLASRLHWRILTATVLILMAAAFVAPKFLRAPDLDENRVLAEKPAWPTGLADFRDFRKKADAYVADHFPARPYLIGALNRVRMMFGVSGSKRVIVGRHGWLFYDAGDHLTATTQPGSLAEARGWLGNLAGRTEALRAQGVPYIVLIPPMQEAIYPEEMAGWYRLNPDRRAVRYTRLAQASRAGNMVYLYEPIAAAKARGVDVYTRHDTHWNGPAAWEGYVALMQALKAQGVTQEDPRPLSDFVEVRPGHPNKPRNLALMLGVASYVKVRYLELGDPPNEGLTSTTWLDPVQDWTKPHVIETGHPGKPVLMMTMDSFSNALVPFLYSHFSRIVLSHSQDGTWREDLMAQFHPNAVVLEMLESGLGYSMDPAPAASPETMARIDAALAALTPAPAEVAAVAATPAAPAAPAPAAPAAPVVLPMPRTSAQQVADLARATPAANCNLELATLAGGTLTLGGWISELAAVNTSPQGVARLEGPGGDFAAPIQLDEPRPDVAAHFKAPPAAAQSGFSETYKIEGLSGGTYAVTVYRRGPQGWMACRSPKPLTAR